VNFLERRGEQAFLLRFPGRQPFLNPMALPFHQTKREMNHLVGHDPTVTIPGKVIKRGVRSWSDMNMAASRSTINPLITNPYSATNRFGN
jgi:hypothetical protein